MNFFILFWVLSDLKILKKYLNFVPESFMSWRDPTLGRPSIVHLDWMWRWRTKMTTKIRNPLPLNSSPRTRNNIQVWKVQRCCNLKIYRPSFVCLISLAFIRKSDKLRVLDWKIVFEGILRYCGLSAELDWLIKVGNT